MTDCYVVRPIVLVGVHKDKESVCVFFPRHTRLFFAIVIITDSFDVSDLKKVLNKAVLQPANLSKAVKRRRGGKSDAKKGK